MGVAGGDAAVRSARVVALSVALAFAVLVAAWAGPAGAAGTAGPAIHYPADLVIKSELSYKANLVRDHVPGGPELIFFGGSRSQRFDPAYAKTKTGLRAANFAISNGRPESAWAVANWLYHRHPDVKQRWVIGVQTSMFRDRDLNPGVLQDGRFYPYFPQDLLDQQRQHLPKTVAKMPKHTFLEGNRYAPTGMLTWCSYDRRRAAGVPLSKILTQYIAMMRKRAVDGGNGGSSARTHLYFEKLLGLLNEHGTTPIIVLMPVHPRVLAAMKSQRSAELRAQDTLASYLAQLSATYKFELFDFTDISSFGGKAADFYDGVHITAANGDRIIAALAKKAGDALK